MGVLAMAQVFASDLPPNLRLVMLAYADHADDHGQNIYPSVAMISAKTGYSRRSVQQITQKLVGKGWLEPDGGGPGGVNRYRLGEPKAPGGRTLSTSGARRRGGAVDCTRADIAPAQILHPRGADTARGGVQRAAPKPPKEEDNADLPVTARSSQRAKLAERGRLLAELDRDVAGFVDGWESWRAALVASKRGNVWGDILKLRRFRELAERYSSAHILDILSLAALRQWQGFEEQWWLEQKKRGSEKKFLDYGPFAETAQREFS